MQTQSRFINKLAIVTGGGQGIGYAIAEKLSSQGATTIIADLNRQKGESAAAQIVKKGFEAHFFRADVSLESDLAGLMDYATKSRRSLDILVNSASPFRTPAGQEALDSWDINMSVLLKGSLLSSIQASRVMSAAGGVIVNISSMVAFAITHQAAGYHVAKAGLEHLTRYLAVEYAGKNIRVNSVCPALVDMDDRTPLTSDPLNQSVVQTVVPLKRAATPGEIADAVAFLCSNEASYITGQCLVVDGGLSAMEPFHASRMAYRQALASPARSIG